MAARRPPPPPPPEFFSRIQAKSSPAMPPEIPGIKKPNAPPPNAMLIPMAPPPPSSSTKPSSMSEIRPLLSPRNSSTKPVAKPFSISEFPLPKYYPPHRQNKVILDVRPIIISPPPALNMNTQILPPPPPPSKDIQNHFVSTCGKCGDSISSDNNFTLKRCNHIFCHKCLHDYIKDNLMIQIKCPEQNCQKNIPDQIIRKCLSNVQTQLYDNLSILASSNKFRKCLTKDCPKIVSVENNNIIFQCSYCEQPNCLKCQKRHYPSDCEKNDLSENDMNYSANEAIKKRKKEALEELCKTDKDVENPEAFDCPVCYNFILPRSGIMLRNCFHCFCRNCFNKRIKDAKDIGMLTCLSCENALDDREVIKEVGAMELKDLVCKQSSSKLFSCKSPDCKGLCDKNNNAKNTFTCPFCFRVNCLDCEDIHEGSTCDDFRQTQRYKDTQKMKNTIGGSVTCRCGILLIRGGGCGALKCPNCFRDICVFTGKLAGNNGPDSCGCTTTNTCHPQCEYGCLPERSMT